MADNDLVTEGQLDDLVSAVATAINGLGTGGLTVADNGDGSVTVTGSSVTDNGDGSVTIV